MAMFATASLGRSPTHRQTTAPEIPKPQIPMSRAPNKENQEAGPPKAEVQQDARKKYDRKLTRAILDDSLSIGRQFLLNHQKPEGNFNYSYNFVDQEFATADNAVRQAGALWGLSLVHRDNPTEESRQALIRGFAFFERHSKLIDPNSRFIIYPKKTVGKTGTIALTSLALIEFLRTETTMADRPKYERDLDAYLSFLISLRRDDGLFHGKYDLQSGKGKGKPSPYSDGEALLALAKAAKYLGRTQYKPMILESADRMYVERVTQPRKKDRDSNTTKGFYQWGSMAFYEIHEAGWGKGDRFSKRTIELAEWMIDVHKTLKRTKNTAYAQEGLAVAWELARKSNNKEAMNRIGAVLDKAMYKLTSWQVGGPLQHKNRFLSSNTTIDPLSVGGVMNSKKDPWLRIDVAQHQMHAIILLKTFAYKD